LATRGLAYADAVGAEAVQVFTSNPRRWAPYPGDPAQDALFRDGCAERGTPVFIHSPYLINLGSPTSETVAKSADALAHALARAQEIGAAGVVVHAGSAVAAGNRDAALKQVREVLLPMLDGLADGGPRVLIEPTAGGGRALAARMESLGDYFAALDAHPALGVCLDVCHAFAAGHDLTAGGGVRQLIDALLAAVGPGRLALVHANDSRDPAGSLRDRHAAVGQGQIGEGPFGELLNHPAVRGVPFITENDEASQPGDIAILKRLRDSAR
jgi:deoxyribonuclease-4